MGLVLSFFGGLVVSIMLIGIMFGFSHLIGDKLIDHLGKVIAFFTILWFFTPIVLMMLLSISGWNLVFLWVGYYFIFALIVLYIFKSDNIENYD
ncbi:MAG: hypothetical protein Q4A21_01875 [bacterium]|nr:hypothetical protein [bacterium]